MKTFSYEESKESLERLTAYMELLNEQMEYTKYEISQYCRRYRQAAKKLREAGQQTDTTVITKAKQSIKYYTKEEYEDAKRKTDSCRKGH